MWILSHTRLLSSKSKINNQIKFRFENQLLRERPPQYFTIFMKKTKELPCGIMRVYPLD
jgi:hypothetical protein